MGLKLVLKCTYTIKLSCLKVSALHRTIVKFPLKRARFFTTKKVMLSAPPPKSELSNGLTLPLSDHCYWSDQTSSIREEEESPASATSLEVTPSPRPESKIDAREDSLEPLSILLPQTLKNQGQEVLHHGVCWEQGGEEDGEQWTANITRGWDRTALSRMIPAPYIYPHMALTSSIRWSNWLLEKLI